RPRRWALLGRRPAPPPPRGAAAEIAPRDRHPPPARLAEDLRPRIDGALDRHETETEAPRVGSRLAPLVGGVRDGLVAVRDRRGVLSQPLVRLGREADAERAVRVQRRLPLCDDLSLPAARGSAPRRPSPPPPRVLGSARDPPGHAAARDREAEVVARRPGELRGTVEAQRGFGILPLHLEGRPLVFLDLDEGAARDRALETPAPERA